MNNDLGVQYTEKQMRDAERTIRHLYKQVSKDIEKELEDFVEDAEEEEVKYEHRVSEGTMTKEEFNQWKSGVVFEGKKWDNKMTKIAAALFLINVVATNMLRDKQINVFTMNNNYAAYDIERGFGISVGFGLYDKKTVVKLLEKKPNILPFKHLDKKKDMKWNFQNIRSALAQGIVKGESIPKIAKRLAEVVPNRNEKQMVLHARTAMTSAQNAGRMERYSEAEALGIKVKKVWLATLDDRTREMHADLDGQEVDPDEPFEIDGYTIMYPGDPHAEPEMVYNCRCTLTTKIVDYPKSFDRRVAENGEVISDMTYREWEASKQNG